MEEKNVIDKFRKPYGFLSNMAACEIEYCGEMFHSVEQAYQFAKCACDADRDKIRRYGGNSALAKRVSLGVRIREDWGDVKLDVMEELLRSKYGIEKYRVKLLSTGLADLIEGNEFFDYYWGKCHGVGQNHLGRLLMEIRQELMQVREEIRKEQEAETP